MSEDLVRADSDLVTAKQLAKELGVAALTIRRQVVTFGVEAKRQSSGHGRNKISALYSRTEFFEKKALYEHQQQQRMYLKRLDKESNEIIDNKPKLALATTLNTLDQLDEKIFTDPEEYLVCLSRILNGVQNKVNEAVAVFIQENRKLKLDLQETQLQLTEAKEECEQLEDDLVNVKDSGQFYTILRWCNEFRGEGVVKKAKRKELSEHCDLYFNHFKTERKRVGENSLGIFERWAYPPEYISQIADILGI